MSFETTLIELVGVSKAFSQNIDTARRNTFLRMVTRPFFRLGIRPSEFLALENISLKIRQGEKVAVLGHNGSGKTTLARLIGGHTVALSGEVAIRGKTRFVHPKAAALRPLMPLRLYTTVMVSLLGTEFGAIRRTVDAILAACGLLAKAEVRVRDVSADDLRAVTLYSCLFIPADIYMFDELGLGQFPELERLVLERSTCLFFTSNADDLPPGFSRVVVLHGGKLVFDGKPEEAKAFYSGLAVLPRRGVDADLNDDSGAGDEEDDVESSPTENVTNPVTPTEPPARRGTGVLRITAMRTMRSSGQSLTTLKTGDPLRLEVDYIAQDHTGSLGRITNVNVVIEDETNRRVFGVPSDVLETDFGTVASEGTFVCEIPKVPLLPGTYSLTCAVLVDGVVADKVIREVSFEVEPGDVFGTGKLPARLFGPVYLPFQWSYQGRDSVPVFDRETADSDEAPSPRP